MIRVFIGYDPREDIAYRVLKHSIESRTDAEIEVKPIKLDDLKGILTRPRNPLQSTDFSFSRFLTPWLTNYQGWSLFMDCDMLMLEDINRLWELRDDRYAVMVVKQVYEPDNSTKFLNQPQTQYPKKNWSSLMLFNGPKCKALTPEYVNTASGLELHQFKWTKEKLVGRLPQKWNFLPTSKPANIHYTEGGPWFAEYANCQFAKEWTDELAKYNATNNKE